MHKEITLTLLLALLSQAAPASRVDRPPEEYWWLCPVDHVVPLRPEYSNNRIATGSTEIRAESARAIDKETTDFIGNAEFIQEDKALIADTVHYDQSTHVGSAEGNATFWGREFVWQGEHMLVDDDAHYSRLERGRFWLANRAGRGKATRIRHDDKANMTYLENVEYTTCPATKKPHGEVWLLTAPKMTFDQGDSTGYATHVRIKVLGTTVFYLPTFSFPLSNDRKTGFLIPSLQTDRTGGSDIRVPYYFNLAANQDLLLIPRIISDRGEGLGADYRYLSRSSRSELEIEALPDDRQLNGANRYAINLTHQQYFAEKTGTVNVLFQNVSDSRYFEDLGGSLGASSQSYLDRHINTMYTLPGKVLVQGWIQSYQNVDSAIPASLGPYRRLPEITATSLFPLVNLQPYFLGLADVAYFQKPNAVSGARVELDPSIALPFVQSWAIVKPTIGVRMTDYYLGNTDTTSQPNITNIATGTSNSGGVPTVLDVLNITNRANAQAFKSELFRAVPTLSFESQLFFERRTDFFGEGILQTLEPHLFYLLVPKQNQNQYPIFDTGLIDFQFLNLFQPNRFSGHDRQGDANQLVIALQSSDFSLTSGREILRTSIGQIYYFRPLDVTIPGVAVTQNPSSDFVAEVASNFVDNWTARQTVQFSPADNRFNKTAVSLRYEPRDNATIINLGYHFTRAAQQTVATIEQADISFRLPMTENLSVVGIWSHSLRAGNSPETLAGLEYEDCCWGFRVFSRRYIATAQGVAASTFGVEVELKGLAGIGHSASSFLTHNLPGFDPFF